MGGIRASMHICRGENALEAWFLADSQAMNAWLKIDDFHEPQREATPDKPWERIFS